MSRETRTYRVYFQDNYGYYRELKYTSDFRNYSKENRQDDENGIIHEIGYKRFERSRIVNTYLDY